MKRQASLEVGIEVPTFWALSGEPIAVIACRPTDPVVFLRRAVEARTGEGGPWRLLLGSRVLGSRESLLDAGVGDGSVVRVVRCGSWRLVVTASLDRKAKLWSSASGECLRSLEGHSRALTGAVFSLDGELVVTASVDGTAKQMAEGRREKGEARREKREDRREKKEERRKKR